MFPERLRGRSAAGSHLHNCDAEGAVITAGTVEVFSGNKFALKIRKFHASFIIPVQYVT